MSDPKPQGIRLAPDPRPDGPDARRARAAAEALLAAFAIAGDASSQLRRASDLIDAFALLHPSIPVPLAAEIAQAIGRQADGLSPALRAGPLGKASALLGVFAGRLAPREPDPFFLFKLGASAAIFAGDAELEALSLAAREADAIARAIDPQASGASPPASPLPQRRI